mmetsp:Transcript_32600/g.45235  ORF Transcript_32600/g.45235 Transcript_32600/m.45235 type:complete len:436 (+) Transcript_32600:80-1387(+)|eukprot:CAMPEP_0196589946 /NCGR_PEP_ID=MMETSP1081-20130531/65068_1 /TAXON_ID=36882 /ORGANISM="Pyramimonas amylifera, Strain CCMP720" /LENGTH=435 /DNA_ID=CAMNT_0041912891 /DNA_START=75 /DNA_END=1382 /DNA_ORIENTATION=-
MARFDDPEASMSEEALLPKNDYPNQDKKFWVIFKNFAIMGWYAFGGPAAHIGIFEKHFVEQQKWMTHSVFAELLALGQCLPGPTSTQVSFAIGVTKGGVLGGLMSGILFQYPGLLIMSLVGLGAAQWLVDPAAWVSALSAGLAAGGVALVVDATFSLAYKLCADRDTQIMCTLSACVAYYTTLHYTPATAWVFPALLASGGLLTRITRRNTPESAGALEVTHIANLGLSITGGALLLVLWVLILIGAVVCRQRIPYEQAPALHWFESFYRTGSLIFGGGQVVLPLLLGEVDAWITDEQFYAGLGIVQALPGPLFNLAAYLGAVIGGWKGIPVAWFGLFGPGVMLIFGVLPFWGWFRQFRLYKLALPGLSSAAVGLIVASLFTMALKVRSISPFPDSSVVIGIISFVLAHLMKAPAPVAIALGGLLGIAAWAASLQ